MGGLFGGLRQPRSPPREKPPLAGQCQFLAAWRFTVAETERFAVDAEKHGGELRSAWFVPIVPGPPAAFTICGAHAKEFVRFMMMTGRDVIRV